MILRFNTLLSVLLPWHKTVKKALVFLMLVIFCPVFSQSSSLDEVKKEASKLFEAEDYSKAYKLYSQLVANYPKDAEYNYKLGVCMIFSEPDKKKCLPYLQFAAKNSNDATKDVLFYLGKAYHINYLFDEAIKNYNGFKETTSAAKQKKLLVDREIAACGYGKHLLSNLTDLVVQSKKELSEADYFRSYDLKDMGGKLLVKPDEFKTSTDKKKKDKSIVFLPKTGNRVYYSSYGENTDNGKDIYYSVKMADGSYGPPQKVKGINTEFDEDYPFLHPNGQALYFASKGHNSMGGYDIFKSTYLEATDSWTEPVNLEFPINSPDDDYLFVTDSLEKTAYFSTGRQSPPGKTDVLKIITERKPIDVLVIKGAVEKGSPDQSLKSKISIKNTSNNQGVGIYYAEDNGDYLLNLPNGAKLLFTVETPGLKTQSQEITLPVADVSRPFKQTISYADGILKIVNDFDAASTDENYLQYLKVIEKKAKLEVNEGENQLATTTTNPTPKNAVKNDSAPQVVDQENGTAPAAAKDPKKGLDNKQLADIAKQDAQESTKEAAQLQQDSNDALEVGQQQKIEADKKTATADEALKNAEAISNEDEKKSAIEKATLLKQEAENESAVASKILEFAKSLDADAKTKQNEATLNEQYAGELEKAINSKNSQESMAKLEELQKQINESAAQKNESENLFNGIKNNIDEKEKQITSIEKTNTDVKNNLQEIKNEISDNDALLEKTKKKKDKEIIVSQTTELKTEQAEKEGQVSKNEADLKKLNDELSELKSELGLATKIKTESIAPVTNTTAAVASTSTTIKENKKENPTVTASEKPAKIAAVKSTPAKQGNQPDFSPLTASTNAEAITKLDKLSTQLGANDNEIFDFNAYQNQQAQSLKVDADAKINDAVAQQKKLKDAIAASKQNIEKAPQETKSGVTSGELIKEGDDLAVKAQSLRTEAGSAAAEQKEKLTNDANELDAKADEKYVEASQVTRTDNRAVFETNKENIQKLIAANKSTPNEIADAKRLNDEAVLSFKKALEIREEANSLTTAGAKLGSLSNAEEIEASALSKQEQSAYILKKANPGIVLKTPPAPGSSSDQVENSGELSVKLQDVNSGVNELANIKIASYEKLYEANNSEAEDLFAKINSNKASLDNTPALKSDFISGSDKLEKAKAFKQNSEAAASPNEKLNELTAAIKKQLEAIKQLSSLNAALDKVPVAKETTTPAIEVPKQDNAIIEKTEPAVLTSEPVKETKTEVVVTEPPVKETPTVSPQNNTNIQDSIAVANAKTIDINQLAKEDSTAGQLVNYLSNNKAALKSEQADASVKNSLEQLRVSEAEINSLEEKIKTAQSPSTDPPVSPAELKTKADNLLVEAEDLNSKAAEVRTSAESKTGDEKEQLLTSASDLDKQSQDKKIDAAALNQKANFSDYSANNAAIDELMGKLKNDNPTLFAELSPKSKELATSNKQATKLREEADGISNNAARLGAISNVEEKEAELILKQNQLITELKKQYPDYAVKSFDPNTANGETPEALAQKRDQLRGKQYEALTNLTNAFSLEYEASKNNVPAKLNAEQGAIKKNADELNAESKRLLIRSSQEPDEHEKLKLATLSAKAGNAAVEQLNKLVPEKKIVAAKKTPKENAELNKIGDTIAASNTNGKKNKPAPVVTTPATEKNNTAKNIVRVDGLEIKKGNAYNNDKPIPLDAKIEDGLVFRVQIGAFKTRLANDAFKGLSPLNGETTPSGYIRYTAGNFNKIENANAVKNDLRGLGYSDAFVVVYYNGKRISLNEALAILNKEGKTVDPNAPQTAGITANSNVPKPAVVAAGANAVAQETVVVTKELEQLNGLLYTIQIGVYNREITKRQLLNLKPIFTERLNNGLFRYTAGIYNNADRLITDKRRVVDIGIKDAFVSAYLNGKRIPFSEGKTRQAEDSSIKMETENPIIFSDVINNTPANNTTEALPPVSTNTTVAQVTSTVQPFKNNVSSSPAPTSENGIKSNEDGITFKVQIGAYSKQVPEDVAAKFSSITTWPIENKQINGLFIYNIGNFSEAKFAKALKEEALKIGITDAFITVYKNGLKLYGTEASEALSR